MHQISKPLYEVCKISLSFFCRLHDEMTFRTDRVEVLLSLVSLFSALRIVHVAHILSLLGIAGLEEEKRLRWGQGRTGLMEGPQEWH